MKWKTVAMSTINVIFTRQMALQIPNGAAFDLSDTYPIVTLVFSSASFFSQVEVKNDTTVTTSGLPVDVQMTVNINWVEGAGLYYNEKSASFTLSPAGYKSCTPGSNCNNSRNLVFPGSDPQVLFALTVANKPATDTFKYILDGKANFNTVINSTLPPGNWKALTLYNGTDKPINVTAATPDIILSPNVWDQIGQNNFTIQSKSPYYFCFYPCSTTLTFFIPNTKTYASLGDASVVFGVDGKTAACTAGSGFSFTTDTVTNVNFNSGTALVPLLTLGSTNLYNTRMEFSMSPTLPLQHTPCSLFILPNVYYKVYVSTAVPMFCPWNTKVVPPVSTYTGLFYKDTAPYTAQIYAPTLTFSVTARDTIANTTDNTVTLPNAASPLTYLRTKNEDLGQYTYDVLITVAVINTEKVIIKGSFKQNAEDNSNFSSGNAVTTTLYDQFNRPWFRLITQPKKITVNDVLTPVFSATIVGLDYTDPTYKQLLDPFIAKNMGCQNMFNYGENYFLPGLLFTMTSSKGVLAVANKSWTNYVDVSLDLTAIMAGPGTVDPPNYQSPNFTFERVTTNTRDYLLLKTADDGRYVQPFEQKTPNCNKYDTYTYLGTAGSACKLPDNPNDPPVCQWTVAFSTNQLGTSRGDPPTNNLNTLLLKISNGNILSFHVKADACYGATAQEDFSIFSDPDYDYNPYVMLFQAMDVPVRAWLPYGPFFANPYYRSPYISYKTTGLSFTTVAGKGNDTNLACLSGVVDMPAGCDGLTNSCILGATKLGKIMCATMNVAVSQDNATAFIEKYCAKKFTKQDNGITCNPIVGVPQTQCSGFLSADYGDSCSYVCSSTDGENVCNTAMNQYCTNYPASADCACISAGQGNNFVTPLIVDADQRPLTYTDMVNALDPKIAYNPHCVWLPCFQNVNGHALVTSTIKKACPSKLISCINYANITDFQNSTGITLSQINDCEASASALRAAKRTNQASASKNTASFTQPWAIAAYCLGGLLLALFIWVVVLALRPKSAQKSTVYFVG